MKTNTQLLSILDLKEFIKDNKLKLQIKINHYRKIQWFIGCHGDTHTHAIDGYFQKHEFADQLNESHTIEIGEIGEWSYSTQKKLIVCEKGGKTSISLINPYTKDVIKTVESVCSEDDVFSKKVGLHHCILKLHKSLNKSVV